MENDKGAAMNCALLLAGLLSITGITRVADADPNANLDSNSYSHSYLDSDSDPYPYPDMDVTLTRVPGVLAGSLLVPESSASVPVVLIVAGSGPTDRNGNQPGMANNSLKYLAYGLYDEDIATLRVDKRGVGGSVSAGIPEIDLRFEHFVDDIAAWVDWLARDQRFSEVIIAGHSEGSLIGLLAAVQGQQVQRFISIAGPARRADYILRDQLASQPEFVRNTAYPLLDSLVAGVKVDGIAPMFAPLFRESIQPYLISWFAYTPSEIVDGNDISVLIINGNTDIQVPAEEGLLLANASDQAIFVEINDMNHVLKKVDADMQRNIATYTNPDLPLHPELIPVIVTYIRGD